MKKIINTTVLLIGFAAILAIAVGCGDAAPDQGPDDPMPNTQEPDTGEGTVDGGEIPLEGGKPAKKDDGEKNDGEPGEEGEDGAP